MLDLFDADTLITGERDAYPFGAFRPLWDWLVEQGETERIKIPRRQYDEIVAGRGDLVGWLTLEEMWHALFLDEDVDAMLFDRVVQDCCGGLDEIGLEAVGRDPFLVAYAMAATDQRRVMTFEVSTLSKIRRNRRLPDVCTDLGVPSCRLFDMVRALGFAM